MRLLAAHFACVNWQALSIGAGTLVILVVLPRIARRVPASIVAVVLSTVAVAVFRLHVDTIGSKFGGLPGGLPPVAIPDFHSEHILPLLPSAFTVALLAALESMLSAVVADGMTGDRHNPNVELVAQGIANIASPVFGGIPATGAIAPYGDQHSRRRPLAGFGYGARAHPPGGSAGGGAACELHSPCNVGSGVVRRGLQHGRVERNRRHSAIGFRRHFRLADHICADGFC
jgi:hypothetical protein